MLIVELNRHVELHRRVELNRHVELFHIFELKCYMRLQTGADIFLWWLITLCFKRPEASSISRDLHF